MNKLSSFIVIVLLSVLAFTQCSEPEYTPKPKGYMYMELPQKNYQVFDDNTYPYSFEYPSYAEIEKISDPHGKYWLNVKFRGMNAAFYLSYKSMHSSKDFASYLDTCTDFMSMHYQKSSGIEEQYYEDPDNNIHACVYKIKGTAVASPYQFWISDSNRHFLRGALYFNTIPNNDSLAPAIDFLAKDITHLVSTFRWKK